MPFNPFISGAGRNACTLFEIRLETDFIVFRGSEHEASGQLLQGTVVLCLRDAIKVEDVHLRLTGNCRLAWLEVKQLPSGIHTHKVDRTTTIFRHNWPHFVGGSTHPTLAAGNYEWPFELMLPGDMAESVEGLQQTGITYLLKATINRGMLSKNNHTTRRLRLIRTLDPAALEFNHAMSVENIWPNKVDYSIVVPQKAIVFGSAIPVEMRYTPLLKGLEMADITLKLIEIQDFTIKAYYRGQGPGEAISKTHQQERVVTTWTFAVSREEHWHDNIDETGQEGWVVNKDLPLPKKLAKCLQDCNVQGIKIRHKLKLTVGLRNPDGHVSELRATLPVTIFISPNMPLDDEGNLVSHNLGEGSSGTVASDRNVLASETSNMAPPGYGQHVLDQLYDDPDPGGIMTPGHSTALTPGGLHSGLNTPFYALSRAGSSENLRDIGSSHPSAVLPAALTSRLQNVSLEPSHRPFGAGHRNTSHNSLGTHSGGATPFHPAEGDHTGPQTAESSHPHSPVYSRHPSGDGQWNESGQSTPPEPEPEHVDHMDLEELSKVPSYTTATKTPLPRNSSFPTMNLPDYQTATSAPTSPVRTPMLEIADPLATIAEGAQDARPEPAQNSAPPHRRSIGFSFLHSHGGQLHGEGHGERRHRFGIPSRSSSHHG